MEEIYIPVKVNQMIDSAKVVIFSNSKSPYCSETKEIFKGMGQEFISIELDTLERSSDILDYLAQLTGVRMVPRVFINGKCYGGVWEMKYLYQKGELERILE